AEPALLAPRPAPVVPPPVQQRAPEAHPAEVQRSAPSEGRMNRPEAPRGRGEERREDKAEKQK
ncbi:MAG: DEAD/DEAH box helicase, partial [Pseudomonadota bacterium]|nr:DEAD/DEAH box helicase [Pseudomonadota bacterium]